MKLINVSAAMLAERPLLETSGKTTLRFNEHGVRYWLNDETGWVQIDRREDDSKFRIVAEYQG